MACHLMMSPLIPIRPMVHGHPRGALNPQYGEAERSSRTPRVIYVRKKKSQGASKGDATLVT